MCNIIKWFQNITNKNNCRFVRFKISEFYPSTSKELFKNSINFANSMTSIDDNIIQYIKHARKLLSFNNNDVWIKNDDNPTIFYF